MICFPKELPTPLRIVSFWKVSYLFEMPRVSRPCTIARVRGSRGALQLVDGSQPSLARRVRKAPAMVVRRPLFVGTARLVVFPDHFPDRRHSPAWSGKLTPDAP